MWGVGCELCGHEAIIEPALKRTPRRHTQFVRNWLDLLSFLLQGLPSRGCMNAVMSYMLADWYRPGVTLDFPKGGSGEIVASLVRAIEKSPDGRVVPNAHVEQVGWGAVAWVAMGKSTFRYLSPIRHPSSVIRHPLLLTGACHD